MNSAYEQGERKTVIERLDELSRLFHDQQAAGHQGLIAITEYCNVVRIGRAPRRRDAARPSAELTHLCPCPAS
eukprot:1813467-Prymnesium_polylepis.1